jgi:HEAT repeat protein
MPLAEAISSEARPRVRQRLTEMLLGYGADGRASVDQLMRSSNAGVRRTAVQLLRQFGDDDALPDLTAMLDDDEANVRREAVRAILTVGTDRAYAVLESALTSNDQRAGDAIMHELTTLRDGRATPLFCYLINHTDPRGTTSELYLTALSRLGSLGGPEAIETLKSALYRGTWWAPRRTARLRNAAAQALAKIEGPEAREVLREAAASGLRGVRAAARKATA